MNKLNILFVSIVVLLIATVSCNKNDKFNVDISIRDKFLVDKIYDYNNNLLAEYIYDSDNKLTKRVVKDHLVEPNRTIDRRWENEFQYKNGQVSKIKNYSLYVDNSPITGFTQENNDETIFEYDLTGRLIKQNGENLIFRYENGRIVGFVDTEAVKPYMDTLVYNKSDNIIEHIYIRPEFNMVGDPIPGTIIRVVNTYEYDNMLKPNFGLDYLFVFNPFPYIGGVGLVSSLSKNNISKAPEDGYEWVYTYNENGLPETIETKWIGIETLEPMLLRMVYKQIK
jgi:hypothetical protein